MIRSPSRCSVFAQRTASPLPGGGAADLKGGSLEMMQRWPQAHAL